MSNLPQWRIRLVVALPILITKLHLVYGASVLWRAVSYRARVVYMAALPILITKPQLVYGASVLWRAVSYRARVVYIGKLEIYSSTLSSLAQSSGRCKTHKFERKGWQVIQRHVALSPQDRVVGRIQIIFYWLSQRESLSPAIMATLHISIAKALVA